MSYAVLLPLLLVAAPNPQEAVEVTARIDATTLEVGKEYEIVLDAKFSDGWSGGHSGISGPILQIKAPKSVKLTGKVLKTHQELAGNEFLRAPYERLLKELPAKISFTLRKAPAEGDQFSLNFLAYVGSESDDDAWFVRRSMVLSVAPGATATPNTGDDTGWGDGKSLEVGDKATPFSLKRADGSKVSLGKYRGKRNVIVTTYRAFW